MKVLIVDDSVIMRKKLEKAVVELGHEVVGQALNGLMAIEMYRDLKPDVVTMDITMPDMDGVTATKKIREEFPKAKIIMVTSMEQQQLVLEAIIAGAICYVTKPFDVETLRECIERAEQML